MTGESGLVPRLQFLARVVRKECAHLALTDQRLFGAETTGSKFTLAQAKQLESDHEFDIIVLAALKPQAEQELTIENLP